MCFTPQPTKAVWYFFTSGYPAAQLGWSVFGMSGDKKSCSGCMLETIWYSRVILCGDIDLGYWCCHGVTLI